MPTTREATGSSFMLRCAELGLSDEALEGMSCGMIYDMLIEKSNDSEKYPIKGRTGSMRDFMMGGCKL